MVDSVGTHFRRWMADSVVIHFIVLDIIRQVHCAFGSSEKAAGPTGRCHDRENSARFPWNILGGSIQRGGRARACL